MTNDHGSTTLGGTGFCFLVSDGQVEMHDNVIIITEHTVTNTQTSQTYQQGGVCSLSTITLGTSAGYDAETGIVSPGACAWSTTTAAGQQQLTMNIGQMAPCPAVDLDDPR